MEFSEFCNCRFDGGNRRFACRPRVIGFENVHAQSGGIGGTHEMGAP